MDKDFAEMKWNLYNNCIQILTIFVSCSLIFRKYMKMIRTPFKISRSQANFKKYAIILNEGPSSEQYQDNVTTSLAHELLPKLEENFQDIDQLSTVLQVCKILLLL